MTIWTLRLVACAGLVALLGRMPAVTSVSAAFGVVLAGASAIALVAGASLLVARRRAGLAHGPSVSA